MKNARSLCLAVFVVLSIANPKFAHAGCSEPNLSAPVPEFQALQTSRINALLRFGEKHNLCFGIQYVDTALLTELLDFHIGGGTVAQTIRSILGQDGLLSIEVREGVIEVSRTSPVSQIKNIFDYVLPVFDARRTSIQELSNVLAMQLVLDLIAPKTTGFAGSYPSGDLKDEAGPFMEHNRSLRYLLNEIVGHSRGGAWIASIPWVLRGDFRIPEKRRVWTLLEYGAPSESYNGILHDIAAQLNLESTSGLSYSNPKVQGTHSFSPPQFERPPDERNWHCSPFHV